MIKGLPPVVVLAWRDLRWSRGRSWLLVIAVALNVATVSGVYSAAEVSREALRRDSRAWLAADVSAETRDAIGDDRMAALDRLHAEWTLMTMATTMAWSANSADRGFISVKSIDPRVYPFYGSLGLEPAQRLTADQVAVSQEVLDRLRVRVGDSISIAGHPFRIGARIVAEPDRFTGALGVGMRSIVSQDSFQALASSVSASKNRVLVRLRSPSDLPAVRQQLQELFPEGTVSDYRDANQHAIPRMETAISFLAVAAFLAAAIGTIGIAMAVLHHTQTRTHLVAVMKMLGARTPQIIAVLAFQIGWCLVAAFGGGLPFALITRTIILSIAGRYIVLTSSDHANFLPVVWSAFAALAAIVPILAAAAQSIRQVRPAMLLRRDFQSQATAVSRSWLWLAATSSILALAAIGHEMFRGWRPAIRVAAGFGASAALTYLLVTVALYFLRRSMPSWPVLHYAVASLSRRGNHMRPLMVASALSIVTMIATFEAGGAVTRALVDLLPYDRDTLLVISVRGTDQETLRSVLQRETGVESVQILTRTQVRITAIDGVPSSSSSYAAVCDNAGGAILDTETAGALGVHLGSSLQIDTPRRRVIERVIRIQDLPARERFWAKMKFDCGVPDEADISHEALVQAKPGQAPAVRASIGNQYPGLAVITTDDIGETVHALTSDAVRLVRIIAWYAIASAFCTVVAGVICSRTARIAEIGILAALGAGRRKLFRIYTVEFLGLGLVAGVVGCLVSTVFISAGLSAIFRRIELLTEWRVMLAFITASVASAIGAGWLAVYPLLRRRPLETLRSE